ncbi:MAG: Omp28 family outer membrane lipoprotein [Bacteroidaceae bacterium]|nr:Omp28 family outer membrane lipoprotein [Bacteroidaceae bacterium]
MIKNILKRRWVCDSLAVVMLLLASCSHIDESEQLIYVKPASVGRSVLIEDFTGQRCINCPRATQTIAELQEAYGEEKVVAVAFHSGPFGSTVRGVRYPMTTDIGEAYFAHWGLSSQPVGIVSRHGPSDYSDWGTQVYTLLQQTARVKMDLAVAYDADTRKTDFTVTLMGTEGDLDGKLQLWLTEDSITAFQYLPDGSTDQQYTHNHIFRDAVNDLWGSDLSLAEGETTEETFSYTIPVDKDWKPEHMHVVAFVYTDQGVEQVVAEPLQP